MFDKNLNREPLMSTKNLKKKFAHDIMFADGTIQFCRINISHLTVSDNKIDRKYASIRSIPDGADYNMDIVFVDEDQWRCDYNLIDNHICVSYSYKVMLNDTIYITDKNVGTDIPLHCDVKDITLMEIYRATISKEGLPIVWPVIYEVEGKIDRTNEDLERDIIENFIEGGDKYSYKQVLEDIVIEHKNTYEMNTNDNIINEGLDIESAAEFFTVDDIVDEKDGKPTSYNPHTKLLSVYEYDKENKVIHVDLHYKDSVDNYLVPFREPIFSYDICTDAPTICLVRYPESGEFRKDTRADIKYTIGDAGVIEELIIDTKDGGHIESTLSKINDSTTSLKIVCSINDDCISLMNNNTVGAYGMYYNTICSFMYQGDIFNTSNIKSFVYKDNFLFVRGIDYNLIRIH